MIIERGMTSHDRSYYHNFLYFVQPQTTEAHVTCGLSSIVFTTWSDVFTSPWDVVHQQTGRRAGFFSFFISHCCITSSFKQLIVISSLSAPYNYPASLLLYTRESNITPSSILKYRAERDAIAFVVGCYQQRANQLGFSLFSFFS